jgi:hypothetical protein
LDVYVISPYAVPDFAEQISGANGLRHLTRRLWQLTAN